MKEKKKTKISPKPSIPPPAMPNLPQELIQEILLRLPIKSLLQFKSVSKPWLSLISNPHFAKLHLKILSQKPNNSTHKILLSTARHLRSLDYESSSVDNLALMDLHFPFKSENKYVKIVGSCNGLICLALGNHKDFFIWNPLTGDYKKLPVPDITPNSYDYVCGFGYDLSSDDYKVVVANCSIGASFDQKMFKVFKMRTNSWTSILIQDPYCHVLSSESSQGFLSNGALHWLAEWGNHPDKFKAIFAFDLAEEKFQRVQMPDLVVEDDSCFINLGVLGDCLCLSCDIDSWVEVWVMKEYGVKASWARLIKVGSCGEFDGHLIPLCFTKSGHFISMSNGEELVCSNPEEMTIKKIILIEDWEPFDAVVYVESLISPNALNEIER